MFEEQIPEDRQQVLRDIDSIMCNMLEVEPNGGVQLIGVLVESFH